MSPQTTVQVPRRIYLFVPLPLDLEIPWTNSLFSLLFLFSHSIAIISVTYFFRLPSLYLLPDLLLHLDTIISMSPPVCSLAPFGTVTRLKQKIMSQDLQWGEKGYLPAPSTFVVFQLCYINMAEPADIIRIVIDAGTSMGTSLSFSIALSCFPPFLQNLSYLFPILWSVPEIKNENRNREGSIKTKRQKKTVSGKHPRRW